MSWTLGNLGNNDIAEGAMIPFDLHTLWPEAVYLAPLLLIFLWGFLALAHYRKRLLDKFNFAVITPSAKGIFGFKAFFFCLAWLLIVIALMQPVGNGHYPEGGIPPQTKSVNQTLELRRKAHDIIILVDASASMEIRDARQKKSRLEFAKTIADEIVSNLSGENVALYAFTSMPTELSPLTMDELFIRFMLAELQINEGGLAGTNLYEALAVIRKKHFSIPTKRLKTVILLSDGGDTSIEALSGDEKSKSIETLLDLFSDAKEQQLRIYSIGIGSKEGGIVPDVSDAGKPIQSLLQEDLLRKIANRGRGSYYEANLFSPISLAEDLKAKMNQDPQYYDENQVMSENSLLQTLVGNSNLIYDYYFQIPLGIALLLLGFFYFWPDSMKFRQGFRP